MLSYYIRCSTGSALVKIPECDLPPSAKAQLAIQEAKEQGCLPVQSGPDDRFGIPFLIYEVVPQEDKWYNRLITEAEAQAMRSSPNGLEGIR